MLYIPPEERTGRNFGLDLVRAVAIMMVVVGHGGSFIPRAFNKYKTLDVISFLGVEIFFVLSGFLIGNILLRTFADQPANFKTILAFWKRRWWRTLPNYYLFLILNLTLFAWLFNDPQPVNVRYFFFLQNFTTPCPFFMQESWSLTVEEWFYLLLPLVLLLFIGLGRKKSGGILAAIVSFIFFFTVLRVLQASDFGGSWDEMIRKVVIFRLDSIGYGVLVAYVATYHNAIVRKYSKSLFAVGGVIVLSMAVVFAKNVSGNMSSFFLRTFFFSLTSASIALMLAELQTWTPKSRFIQYGVTHISIVSYSMYLIHLSFARPLVILCFAQNRPPWIVAFSIYFLVTVLTSTIVYRFFEKPMTSFRDASDSKFDTLRGV